MTAVASRPLVDDVLTALRRIIRAIDLHSCALVQRCGLTGPQLVLLHALAKRGEVSVGELAEAVSLGQATVTGILDRLERRGLAARRRSEEDKRRVLVHPTEAGLRLIAQTPPLLQESFVEQFKRLSDWEQNMILAALQRLVEMMEARSIDATPMLATGPIDVTAEQAGQYFRSPTAPGSEGGSQTPEPASA
ncbi:MAG TPA: MarR family transcriptional regulator [Phycisphaeraceae bacterium]